MVKDFLMTTVTDYANAQYNADSSVDLDILTDEYGWIPTTINPDDNDQEPHVIQVKQWLVDNEGSIASHEPYVATQEELDAQALAEFKASREIAVSQIQVTTASGKTFDGDETSQNRITRAVTSSSAGDTTTWVLANNIATTVSHDELREALRLAGEEQTALWVQPEEEGT
jgi:hypothetical protein